MTATIADLVAQLRQVRETLAAAVVTARRAEADARQAGSHYREAATGTDHPKLKQAVADVEVAADKSAKVARLLSEAEERFAAYVARIAPEAAGQDVTTTATPTGEQLLTDTERRRQDRRSRAGRFQGKSVKVINEHDGEAKKIEKRVTDLASLIKDRIRPGDARAVVGTAKDGPAARPVVKKSDHPVVDTVIALMATTLVVQEIVSKVKKRKKGNRNAGKA